MVLEEDKKIESSSNQTSNLSDSKTFRNGTTKESIKTKKIIDN